MAMTNTEKATKYRLANPEKCREYARRWQQKNRDRVSELNRQWRQDHPEYGTDWKRQHPESNAASARRYRYAYPERTAANRAIRRAVATGMMTPQPCAICGAGKAHAHHPDYNQPLTVVWLCRKYHSQAHAQVRDSQL